VDSQTASLIDAVIRSKDFEAKKGTSTLVYSPSGQMPRILLVGLGKEKDISLKGYKEVIGNAVIAAQGKKQTALSIRIPQELEKKFGPYACGYYGALAAMLAEYSFDQHKQKDAQVIPMSSCTFVSQLNGKDEKQLIKGIEEGRLVAGVINDIRHLGNTPPGIMTPTLLSKETVRLSKNIKNVSVNILSLPDIKKLGMGCLLGVSQGSVEEPKFIIVEYKGGAASSKPTVLIGKGITFDSGGLSIKPDAYMSDMKFDMLGAATALGSILAAAKLNVKKNIVALLPSCENMPSGSSYRPDDILIAMNGQSVLVENTDAEGRLILADALCYAHTYNPKDVIDFATLTGACMVALGNERSGLFSPEQSLIEGLLQAGSKAGEYLWHLPLGEEYSEAIKAEVADIKNLGGVGGSRYGGASTAAAFLQYFTEDPKTKKTYPWAHLDLSSCYTGTKGKSYIRGGANGFGVQTMVEYLRG